MLLSLYGYLLSSSFAASAVDTFIVSHTLFVSHANIDNVSVDTLADTVSSSRSYGYRFVDKV